MLAQRNNDYLDARSYAYLVIARSEEDSFVSLGTGVAIRLCKKSLRVNIRGTVPLFSQRIAMLPWVARYDMEEMSEISQVSKIVMSLNNIYKAGKSSPFRGGDGSCDRP